MIVDRLAIGIGKKVGIALLLSKIRAAAEGKLGPAWKARYWALAGVKTWSGLGVTVAAGVAQYLGHTDVAMALGSIAGLLVQAGLLDKAWRGQIPAALAESPVYRALAAHPADLATLCGLVAARLAACGEPCRWWALGFAGLTAALAELALLDPAARARPPARPPASPLDQAA